jgi:hypothetical protein
MLYGPCDTTDNCVGGETCEGTHCGCGGELLGATAVAPNILIALDRSQSMSTEVGNSGMSRWQVAQIAMKNVAKKYENAIRFGLVLWPGNSPSCAVSEHDCQGVNNAVALGFGNGDAVAAYLGRPDVKQCSLGTPIGNTLTVLDSYAGLDDTAHPNYIMLVTDGQEQNCNGNGPAAATALRQHTPEIKTFAVGFSQDVDTATLTAIATNGGTARAGTPKYYQADDQAQLETAFDNIAGSVVSCDYALSSEPNDPSRLFVFLGTTSIPRDMTHATGWDYNATTKRLTFYGATCNQIRTGSGGALSVVFGCTVIP